MSFRRIIFWSHLCVAVAASLLILSLSVTGFVIAYERQFVEKADAQYDALPDGRAPLSADALADIAANFDHENPIELIFRNTVGASIKADMKRGGQYVLDPYTGEVLAKGGTQTKNLFDKLTRLHRSLLLKGQAGSTASSALGLANFAFVFLVVTGAYLWWPKSWRWRIVSKSLLFRRGLPSSKARDYNWHHVLGVWAFIPLFFIATSGVVISYKWAHQLVYQVYGEQVPDLSFVPRQDPLPPKAPTAYLGPDVTFQVMLEKSMALAPDWRKITILLPRSADQRTVGVQIDSGNGAQPKLQKIAYYDRTDGRQLEILPQDYEQTPGRRARIFLRFLHTGEVYGLLGQTVAALASFASIIMVYTGLALSYRRLIRPILRRRRGGS